MTNSTPVTAVFVVVAAGGCSIIYNPDKIPGRNDAAIDAVIDADPSMLRLIDVGPTTILEGQGDASRPATLVIHGSNFVAGATVELAATTAIKIDVDNAMLVVSAGGDYLAVPVIAHVDATIGDGSMVPLTVKVSQPVPGGSSAMATLDGGVSLRGLDELDAPVVQWTTLKPLYSSVNLSGNIDLTTGTSAPRVIRATSSIAVGSLAARATNGSGTTGGKGFAGGCNGGDGLASVTCGHNGSPAQGNVVAGGGGGGAGFAVPGTSGGGSGGGGGLALGDDLIADLTESVPGGGGGGAGAALGLPGGGGGGGGGVVVLTSDGDLTIGTTAIPGGIDARGGAGAVSSGGGGGGAGGAILVHAGHALTVTGTLLATNATAAGNGGTGSMGKIRWDAPTGSAPTAMPSPVRGASFAQDTPVAVTRRSATLHVIGSAGHAFNLSSSDAFGSPRLGPQNVTYGSDGTVDVNVPWIDGYNHVCLQDVNIKQGGTPSVTTCVDVAYLP